MKLMIKRMNRLKFADSQVTREGAGLNGRLRMKWKGGARVYPDRTWSQDKKKYRKDQDAAVVVAAAVVVSTVAVSVGCTVVWVIVGFAVAAIAADFAAEPPPLVTGAAAIPVRASTDNITDPCPTVVEPPVSNFPSL